MTAPACHVQKTDIEIASLKMNGAEEKRGSHSLAAEWLVKVSLGQRTDFVACHWTKSVLLTSRHSFARPTTLARTHGLSLLFPTKAESVMSTLATILSSSLLSRRGQVKTDEGLRGKRVIGLYFMLSTCRQCEKFTPALATVYRNTTLPVYRDLDMQRSFDVVVVPGDCDSHAFRQKLLQMPFLAIPFYRRPTVRDLYKRYDVKSVPTLIFVDETGEVIERDGRSLVDSHFKDLRVIWSRLRRNQDQKSGNPDV